MRIVFLVVKKQHKYVYEGISDPVVYEDMSICEDIKYADSLLKMMKISLLMQNIILLNKLSILLKTLNILL